MFPAFFFYFDRFHKALRMFLDAYHEYLLVVADFLISSKFFLDFFCVPKIFKGFPCSHRFALICHRFIRLSLNYAKVWRFSSITILKYYLSSFFQLLQLLGKKFVLVLTDLHERPQIFVDFHRFPFFVFGFLGIIALFANI